MPTLIVSLFLAVLSAADDSARREAQALVDTIESLQRPVEDFRCEYEGTNRARGKVAEDMFVGEDEVVDAYRGIFIWKAGGDTHVESWHRETVNTAIRRESIVVRTKPRQAALFSRFHDASINASRTNDPAHIQTWQSTMGTIFLFDKIKREVADPSYDPSVSDEQVDGRSLKVLSIGLTGVPNSLLCQYWIDLARNGQVVRQDSYLGRLGVTGRLDIKLAPFRIGNAEVWMPVSGESVAYAAQVDRKPVVMKEPQFIETISVVDGTMNFNKHPGPEVFTLQHDPSKSASDSLRKLESQYLKQKTDAGAVKPEVEWKILERRAREHGHNLAPVTVSMSDGFPWFTWLTWGFSALVVVSLIALGIQRRRH